MTVRNDETPRLTDEAVEALKNKGYQTLGRKLAAAFIAHRLGVKLDYAHKKYLKDKVGPYWILIAHMVTTDMNAGTDALFENMYVKLTDRTQ